MEYSVGDKIIFNKKYVKMLGEYTTIESDGWIEGWLIDRVATITRKIEKWYYIDIPYTHGYDKFLFNKLTDESLVEL